MRTTILLFCAALAGGCQHLPDSAAAPDGDAKKGARSGGGSNGSRAGLALKAPERARRIHLELVRQMVDRGLYYAAIAHLDAEREAGRTPEGLWLRAEALRHIGRNDEAEKLYRQLTAGAMAGPAYRGLGLLAAARRDYSAALAHLDRAREMAPTDPRVRNDLGFALLLAGRTEEARRQLATAIELGENDVRSTHNLILLFLATGDSKSADRLAKRQEVGRKDMKRLRQRAKTIRAEWRVAARNPTVSQPATAAVKEAP